jgi:hypothetical protein
MRIANCKTVCREIEEADHAQHLSTPVTEHLAACGQCQKFYDERRKLRQLVGSLETVAAPLDFDLRVRSRLANERVDSRAGLLFSNFKLGFASAALATLVLVFGGVFAFRMWNAPTTNMTGVQTKTPEASGPSRQTGQPQSTESGLRSNAEKQVMATAKGDSSEASRRDRQLKRKSPLRSAVASSRNDRRLVTKEFSSTAAPVVKKEETVASLESPIFLIEASTQPLKLSLDYSGGVSRTISVPALSFGSEGVLAGDGLSLVKNSPKGVW